MNWRKSLAILGLVGAVVAAAVAGTAFAQTPTPGPKEQAKANYQEFFLSRLAAALGTTPEKLNSAFTQARNETTDQQVKDGRLTQQQADRIKSQQGSVPFGFGHPGFARGQKNGVPFMGGSQVHDEIAKALGMTTQELATQLRSGKTLAELSRGKEQAVKDAVVAAEKARLDQAVKDGRITQERADQMLDKIRNSDLSKLVGPMGAFKGKGRGNGNGKPAPAPRSS